MSSSEWGDCALPERRDSVNPGAGTRIVASGTDSDGETMCNWLRLFIVGAAASVLLKTPRNARFPMAIAEGKSTIRSFF